MSVEDVGQIDVSNTNNTRFVVAVRNFKPTVLLPRLEEELGGKFHEEEFIFMLLIENSVIGALERGDIEELGKLIKQRSKTHLPPYQRERHQETWNCH